MNITNAKRLYRAIDDIVKQIGWLRFSVVKHVVVRALTLRPRLTTANVSVFEEMKRECIAVAKAMKTTWQTVFCYQCMYDISQMDITVASACTVGSVGPLFIRVVDWGIPDGIGKYTEKTVMIAEHGSKFTSVGFSGFIGTVTAIGKEWAVALNQSPVAGTNEAGVPSCYYTRIFAERFGAAINMGEPMRQAVKRILGEFERHDINPMSSMILVVRDHSHHGLIEFIVGRKPAIITSRWMSQ